MGWDLPGLLELPRLWGTGRNKTQDGPDPAVSQYDLGYLSYWEVLWSLEQRWVAGQLAASSAAAVWIAEGREGSSTQRQDWGWMTGPVEGKV